MYYPSGNAASNHWRLEAKEVKKLLELWGAALMIMATTGLFNNKDQAVGQLNIYKKDAELLGNQSPWERLIERTEGSAGRS